MAAGAQTVSSVPGAGGPQPHFPPKAKRVIYLFQSGGPSHMDLFDYKPLLAKVNGSDLPTSIRQGQRLTEYDARRRSAFPSCSRSSSSSSKGSLARGSANLMPHTAKVADDISFIKSCIPNRSITILR